MTRAKEPEFETAQRVRPFRVKSSAELEEEVIAKMPKFKATRLNKKASAQYVKNRKLIILTCWILSLMVA